MYELNADGNRLESNGDYVIDEFGVGQCYTSKQIPADAFDDAAELGVMAQNIIDVLPSSRACFSASLSRTRSPAWSPLQ